MGLWVFMLAMSELIPAIMVVIGIVFRKHAPAEINWVYGYRTVMSMKNMDTWTFAHHYIGKIWLWVGIVLAAVSFVPLLFVIGETPDTVGNCALPIVIVQLVLMVLPIVPTEIALRKHFDKDGNHKQPRAISEGY